MHLFICMCFFFFFKQKTAYEIGVRLVGSEMCIRDRSIPLIIIEWLVIDGGIDVSTRRTIFSEYTQWESWNRRSCLVAVRTGTSSADQSGTEEGSARGRYRVAMVLRRSVATCASTGLTTRH